MVNVLSSRVWTGVNVDASQFSGLQTSRLAWGDVEDSTKSAYAFRGYPGVQVPLDGSKVPIGEFQHHETPNLSDMPQDRVELEQLDFDKVVEVEGRWYDMRVQGFLQYGQIAPVFISPEGSINIADLVVSFTPYTGPA